MDRSQSAPHVPQPDENDFEELVERCLRLLESQGAAALETVYVNYPDRAEHLRETIGKLVHAGLVHPAADSADFPETLGEFRLLERVGVGGMGVVFRAEQPSLHREVAVKLIRPDYLYFPGARERLRREVEAVGRLDHPGIVSIYTVGEDDEMPYFAMEFVHGTTLEQALQGLRGSDPRALTGQDLYAQVVARVGEGSDSGYRLPGLYRGSWPQVCTRIVRQVAEALAHAHGRGIVHRDIKPSNIMLTPGGRVLVVDFGLARLHTAPRLTRSGAILGSLAYMPPEQILGDAQDERVDVYSLGVTLFEALTLQLPHDGTDSNEVQRQIVAGELRGPRSLNDAIPRDLETVCINAMQVDVPRRYDSAQSLCEDLTNVLELRPVQARRPGIVLRLLRWTQRHRAAAVAIVLAVTLMVGLPTALWWQQRAANREIAKRNQEIRVTNDALSTERDKAERHFARALDTVDLLLTQVAERRLRDVPEIASVRKALMNDALDSYESFLAQRPGDLALRERVANAATTVATDAALSGDNKRAGELFERAIELWEGIYDQQPEAGPRLWAALIAATESSVNPFGMEAGQDGDEILARVGAADVRLQAMTDRHLASAPEAQHPPIKLLKLISKRLRLHFAVTVRRLEAAEFFSKMKGIEAEMCAVLERWPSGAVTAALGRNALMRAQHRENLQEYAKAAEVYGEAVTWLDRAGEAEDRPVFQQRYDLLRSLNGRARTLGHIVENPESLSVASRATAHADESLRRFPDYVEMQFHRGMAYQQLALSWANSGDKLRAMKAINVAVSTHRAVLERQPRLRIAELMLWDDLHFRCLFATYLLNHNVIRADVEVMRGLKRDPASLVRTAQYRAVAAHMVRSDHTLSPEGRAEAADRDEAAAVEILGEAVDAGLQDPAQLRLRAFVQLAARDDFKAVQARLEPKK